MASLRKLSGQQVAKILCNRFRFSVSGRTGSHVRLSKMGPSGKVGCVVPMHPELKLPTLKSILKQARVEVEEFVKHL